jgi:hypothetical protein
MDLYLYLQDIWCFHESFEMAASTTHAAEDAAIAQEPRASEGLYKSYGIDYTFLFVWVFFLHV